MRNPDMNGQAIGCYDEIIRNHLERAVPQSDLLALSQRFRAEGMVKVGSAIPDDVKSAVREDVLRLLDSFGERKDLHLPTTGNTPRRMTTVRSEIIAREGKVIPAVYRSQSLIRFLESIAREHFLPCPRPDEEYLITHQNQPSDTHGWHWGDYSFALIWLIEAPPLEHGGMLQCIPHTDWDKRAPRIHEYLVNNLIRTYSFVSGDLYLLRTDTTLHRTVPLTTASRRTILNMTWGNDSDMSKSLNDGDRWWADDGVAAREVVQ